MVVEEAESIGPFGGSSGVGFCLVFDRRGQVCLDLQAACAKVIAEQ
jgi:hypothetical protein